MSLAKFSISRSCELLCKVSSFSFILVFHVSVLQRFRNVQNVHNSCLMLTLPKCYLI